MTTSPTPSRLSASTTSSHLSYENRLRLSANLTAIRSLSRAQFVSVLSEKTSRSSRCAALSGGVGDHSLGVLEPASGGGIAFARINTARIDAPASRYGAR